MDTPQLTHVSLCAGYGGIDLGLRRVLPDLRTVAYSEIEEYACGLLAARMESGHLDPAPIWSDLKTFPFSEFYGCVDILSGGYPCQPFSAAGKRRGTDDPRHLWPFIADGIRLCQPRICFFENVEGHISLGLQDVLGDLAGLGYRATWGVFSASEVGAPHQRKRVFILAHSCSLGIPRPRNSVGEACLQGQGRENLAPDCQLSNQWMADSHHGRGKQDRVSCQFRPKGPEQSPSHSGAPQSKSFKQIWPAYPDQRQYAWEPPRVVGNAKGERSTAFRSEYEGLGGELCASSASSQSQSGEGLAEASSLNSERGSARAGRRSGSEIDAAGGNAEQQRETQPALGGDADGPAGGMDYADLSIACHNRTDELRLLGNGVVPATAERAFRTLYARLFP